MAATTSLEGVLSLQPVVCMITTLGSESDFRAVVQWASALHSLGVLEPCGSRCGGSRLLTDSNPGRLLGWALHQVQRRWARGLCPMSRPGFPPRPAGEQCPGCLAHLAVVEQRTTHHGGSSPGWSISNRAYPYSEPGRPRLFPSHEVRPPVPGSKKTNRSKAKSGRMMVSG